MPLSAALTSSLFVMPGLRSLPVIASVVLHAGIGIGLVASAGGHARAAAASPVAGIELDVESAEAPLLVPVAAPAPVMPAETLPAHSHTYPVAPSHDAHPHDPALHHEQAPVPAPAAAAPSAAAASTETGAEPAAAAPAVVGDGASLPKFTLASGSGAPMGARVAANAAGSGAAAPSPGGDDTVHAAASVQVAARLVQSVTAAYPNHARADELEGDVGVEIVLDREGRVVEARVTRAAGHGFDEAALAAVRAYRFSPAQREGRAVRVRMPWSVQFRLR